MTDSLSVQPQIQKKDNTVPYGIGGAAIGGIAQQTVENSERDGNTRPPDLSPEESVCRSGSNS